MKWREKYRVHPAADVFPMMSDTELVELGEDIKKNGQTIPVLFWTGDQGKTRVLIDGRNRLEAMERVGILDGALTETFHCKDPVTHIITLNIRRRHLTKQPQADLIVAAHRAAEASSRQVGEMTKQRHVKGKRGSEKDAMKAAAVETAKQHGISKRTIERSFAKAEGKTPKLEPRRYTARPLPKPKSGKPVVGLEAARRHYLDLCAGPGVDLDAEQEIIIDALREIADRRVALKAADLEIPAFLKRGRRR
jgi:hypothetical protein